MIWQEDEGLNNKMAFGHFSFQGVVDSCNVVWLDQDLLALVGDQGEKEIPAGLLGTPIVHGSVLGTLRFAQPTILQYKNLALIGSSNEGAIHVDLIVVLPDQVNPVGWARPALPDLRDFNIKTWPKWGQTMALLI